MTKDEAIFELGYAKDFQTPKRKKAIDMAIEALSIEYTRYWIYKRAFKIACELLNGAVIYGVDADKIFTYVIETSDCADASDYEEFILNNIDRFSDNDELRYKAIKRLGW